MRRLRKGWWEEFVARLRDEPLAALAVEFDRTEADLSSRLADADSGGAAQDAPWWPEAERKIRGGGAVRETARQFGTNARRLRKGLARAGVRAAGSPLGRDGVLALSRARERLGRVPDGVLAREAGVTTEAVQGERRRLGISPYRQVRARTEATLSEDEMAWIRGPERPRRERFRAEADVPTVVRRVPRSEAPEIPVWRIPPRVERAPEAVAIPEDKRRPDYGFFRNERQQEIDALLAAPRRPRDGRQRIIRADTPTLSPPPPPAPVEERPRTVVRRVSAPAWRPATVSAVELEAAANAAPTPPVRPTPAPSPPSSAVPPVLPRRSPIADGHRWLVRSGAVAIEIRALDLLSALVRATELGCAPTQIVRVG